MKQTVSASRLLLLLFLFFLTFAMILLIFALLGMRWISPQAKDTSNQAKTETVVVIDPGHGGEDGGTVGINGVFEKDLNLAISHTLCQLLRGAGVEAVMTREDDVLLYDKSSDYHGHKKEQDLATRRRIAEQYEHTVFISIHMNAFPDSRYKGLQVYYSENHPDSQVLAKSIQSKDRLYLHPDNRRAVKSGGGSLYLLDRLSCPAVLVECGFLSNEEECEALCREETQKKLSLILAASVLEILKEDTEILSTAS